MKIEEEDVETNQMNNQEKYEEPEADEFKVGDKQMSNSFDELFIAKQDIDNDESGFNRVEKNIKSSSTSSLDSFEKRTLKEEIDLHLEMSHLTLGELKEDDLKLNENKTILINNLHKSDNEVQKENKQQTESKINEYTFFNQNEQTVEHRLALANIKVR
jgi:hypothetical protein